MKKPISYIPFSLPRVFLIASCILFLIYKYDREHPKAEWDTSPDKVVISYESGPAEIPYGYIPDFRVWGDGRIVWVNYKEDGTRKVFQEYLSQNELKSLVEWFVDAGYFHWIGGRGSSFDYMRIQLLDIKRDRLLDANKGISKLVDYMKSGAGAAPTEFVPTIGYLHAGPIEEAESPSTKNIPPHWPEEKFNTNFENFEKLFPYGKEITDDELDFVWQIVNHSHFIKSNEKIYWIALEIPKITY